MTYENLMNIKNLNQINRKPKNKHLSRSPNYLKMCGNERYDVSTSWMVDEIISRPIFDWCKNKIYLFLLKNLEKMIILNRRDKKSKFTPLSRSLIALKMCTKDGPQLPMSKLVDQLIFLLFVVVV